VWTNATAPIGAEGSWQRRGTLDGVLGYPSRWFASEKFDDVDGNEYFGVVSDLPDHRRIQIRRMTWAPGDWKFGLVPPPAGVTAIGWTTDTGTETVIQGQHANLVFTSSAFQGRQAHIEIVEHDAGQPDQILSPASVGMTTGDIDLTGTTTTFPWVTQVTPDDDATPNRLEIQVRLKNDPSVISPILYVNLPSGGDHDPYRDGARMREVPPDNTGGNASRPAVKFRVLKETPLGPGIGLLVDLATETEARVEIFDLAGRRLRTISSGRLAKGATVLLWDGRDDAGQIVRGAAFARLATPKETRSQLVLASGVR
jgi:hypothetical protein